MAVRGSLTEAVHEFVYGQVKLAEDGAEGTAVQFTMEGYGRGRCIRFPEHDVAAALAGDLIPETSVQGSDELVARDDRERGHALDGDGVELRGGLVGYRHAALREVFKTEPSGLTDIGASLFLGASLRDAALQRWYLGDPIAVLAGRQLDE